MTERPSMNLNLRPYVTRFLKPGRKKRKLKIKCIQDHQIREAREEVKRQIQGAREETERRTKAEAERQIQEAREEAQRQIQEAERRTNEAERRID